MARVPEHIIENVRQAADIYDVVSEHVDLKKNGRNFKGLCPFHNEKTPSFHIHMDKQIYKCFGCGKGGGTINFIMDVEKLDFLEDLTAPKQLHPQSYLQFESPLDFDLLLNFYYHIH